MLFPLFFVAIFLSHWTLLRLPYFWDEAGYYIPSALDFFRTHTLIPKSTLTNAHPPLPAILLAAWWHLSGVVISGTRTFICMVSASALLAVYRIGRDLSGPITGAVATLLTAVYPIWFAQSTLAHADIFAASFTLWALSFDLPHTTHPPHHTICPPRRTTLLATAFLFSAAVLSKETAIITPLALAGYELFLLLQTARKQSPEAVNTHLAWAAALLSPLLPLLCWYAYHYETTGFVFGNPEFLRYNATANLNPYRILLSLWHRILHLTAHMNMFVPVLCTLATLQRPALPANTRFAIPKAAWLRISIVLIINILAFSILGGALLTRYLLPLYPLLLIVCVSIWRTRMRHWQCIAALSLASFLAAIWINPPYSFAPEDNLTYRDMVVLHVQAISYIDQHFAKPTVLTAWPASAELERPDLGYTRTPVQASVLRDFSSPQMAKAAAHPDAYDTALIFSTKWEPSQGQIDLGKHNASADMRYFDLHHDLNPAEAAALLHGEIVWQQSRKGEWAAVLRFPRLRNVPFPRRP
jgi:4-amino-4-deoxy-L-arabinose transferase-like glycosyltransferase